jgi:type I restriction enzyme S subunit
MKKYQSYKPSKIDWIGEIPTSWEVRKFRFLFVEKKSTQNLSLNSGSISFGQVIYKDDEGIPQERKETYQEVLKGEFLINPLNLNFDLKSLRIGLSEIDVVVSPGYIVLKLNEGLNKGYFKYLLRTFDTQQMKSLGNGVRQTISFKHLSSEELILPPVNEQLQMVKYLDEKVELVDKLISTKGKKITLLKEQRISLINQIVTKGLNPNVKMKNSEVELIGEIPEGWKMTRVSNFGTFFKGNGIKKDEVKDEGIPCIRYGEIYTKYDRIVYCPISFIDLETSKNSIQIKKGDILFTGSGETLVDIGKSLLYYGDENIFVGGDIIVLRLKEGNNPLYLSYLLNSSFVQYQKSLMGRGEIIVHIYSKNIKEIKTPIPPLKEQLQIVEHLDTKTKEIDDLVQLEQKKIDLLKEYRQSLISEVVTGKIKVTN